MTKRKSIILFIGLISLVLASFSFGVGPITGGGVKTISVATNGGISGTSSGGTAPILTLSLNPSLISLGNFNSVGSIPYQNATSAWSNVKIGTGLLFTGGVLSNTVTTGHLAPTSNDTISSTGTLPLAATTGPQVDVTGTTAITATDLVADDSRIIRFTGIATLTQGTTLNLPGGVPTITTANGDWAVVVGGASATTITHFERASGYSSGTFDNIYINAFGNIGPTFGGNSPLYVSKGSVTDSGNYLIASGNDQITIRNRPGAGSIMFDTSSLSGDYNLFFNGSGGAGATFPPNGGALATQAGTETFTNKSIDASQLTGTVANARLPVAAADGSTQGIASFTAADFNSTTGLISLDYVNGQKATTSVPGFLSSTDWTTFNGKQAGNSNLTSWAAITRASGFDTFTATPSSANLRSLLTDENGTGAALFDGATSPAITTPVITGLPTGTGVASGATASTLVSRDANANSIANNFLANGQSIATAGGTTTLTVSSPYRTIFTGNLNQTVVLPVASTLILYQPFQIINQSSGTITVNASGGSTLQTIAPCNAPLFLSAVFYCILTSGTGTTSWGNIYQGSASVRDASYFQVGDISLTNIAALNGAFTSGLYSTDGFGSASAVTITGTAPVVVAHGDGQGGNPTISLNSTVPVVVASPRGTGKTAAFALTTFNVPAADHTYEVSANVLVTTATTHTFTVTLSYTDEGNTARVVTLNFSTLAGVISNAAITNVAGAVPYEGVPLHIRCKASTTIIVQSTGTFTAVTYNIEAIIKQES